MCSKNVIGLVTASFAYSLLVLFQIRGPLDESGEPFVPRLSVFIALVLAIAALLALIASINHTAQSLRVSNVTRKIVREVQVVIHERFPLEPRNEVAVQAPGQVPDRLRPPPADRQAAERQQQELRGAVAIGNERSLQQDVAFGLLLLEDIALRALSPGVNDPNTAVAVLPQLGELVLDILSRPLTPAEATYEDCEFQRPSEPTYTDYVGTAFDQIRRAAVDQPAVLGTLVRTLHSVGDELIGRRLASPEALDALRA